MAKYKYCNKIPCHITLIFENQIQELSLFEGMEYDLPEDHISIKRMLAQGLLKLVNKPSKK